jgi:hypothetical protein
VGSDSRTQELEKPARVEFENGSVKSAGFRMLSVLEFFP